MLNTRKTALAAALILASAGASAQAVFNNGVDGALFDPAAAGRGAMIDFVPSSNISGALGLGTYFGIVFTYTATGAPLWVTFQNEGQRIDFGQTDINGMPVRLFNGGRFGNPFTAPTNTVVGSANVKVLSCDRTQITLDMTEASGLSDVSFDYVPLGGSGACASTVLASCPTGTTAEGANCRLPQNINGNLYLPAGKKYIVQGQVSVTSGATLTLEPGTVVQGSTNQSVPNFLAVLPGGKIFANGTAQAPITFTGPVPSKGSWAGVVIAGRSICNDAVGNSPCQFEAVPSITYGGTTLDDNSGSLRYVRILYAGQAVAPDEELNALTLLGVGSGTQLSYVQVDNGDDDGFEWFGGTVNGHHLVCTNMTDDCFDMDQGFAGKLQFLFSFQGNPGGSFTGDPHGFEMDNDSSNNDKQPRTNPTVFNATIIGNPAATNGEGMRMRRGLGGAFRGVVIDGYADRCINIDDAGTFTQAGSATSQGPGLTLQNSFIGNCSAGRFEDNAADPYTVSGWYTNGTGNQTGEYLKSGSFMPSSAAPFLTGNAVPTDPYFTPVPYKGAFAGPNDRWYADWTVNLPNN